MSHAFWHQSGRVGAVPREEGQEGIPGLAAPRLRAQRKAVDAVQRCRRYGRQCIVT